MQISALVLDIGGVLWLPPDEPLSKKWATLCGLTTTSFDQLVYGSQWSRQALNGTITSGEMWANVGKVLNVSEQDLQELEQDYWKGHWNAPLLEHLKTLKPYCKLGILSDAESNARDIVKPWVNENLFDVLVFSAEEKVCKPDPKIFNVVLQRLGAKANSTLFIDDKLQNVEGARHLGMQAILYEDLPQVLASLNHYVFRAAE